MTVEEIRERIVALREEQRHAEESRDYYLEGMVPVEYLDEALTLVESLLRFGPAPHPIIPDRRD